MTLSLIYIDQLDECGVMAVLLTGGEPLVRQDFPEIVKEITKRGMKIQQFYTNGALLNDKVSDCLFDNGHNPLVIMSYDGVGWHDWLRGIPSAEKAVNEALALCKRRGVRTHVQVVFHRKNLHTMRETVNHLAAMVCESTRLGIVNEQGDWIKNKDDNTLSMQEFIETALDYIPHYYEDGMPISLVISRVSVCGGLNDEFLGYPPIASDTPGEKTMPLREILSTGSDYMNLMNMKQGEFIDSNPECAKCKYLPICGGGCRAMSFRAYGSVTGKDNETCKFFREGWFDRVIETLRRVRPQAKSKLLADNGF